MLFLLFFILLILSVTILGVLASNFFMFQESFGEIVDYNRAYYAAISALERAELVLRYRLPGFEGSGGRFNNANSSTLTVDQRRFGYFSGYDEGASEWKISSRTKVIPKPGEGNVDWMFISGDALNFNMIDYLDREEFIFGIDTGSVNDAYKQGTTTKREVTSFTGIIRLPAFLEQKLGKLKDGINGENNENFPVDIGNDGTSNDAIVQREFNGKYRDDEFTIYPTNTLDYQNGVKVQEKKDSVIREKRINKPDTMTFSNKFGPFADNTLTGLTVISNRESEFSGQNFQAILKNSSVKDIVFRFSLLNLLYSTKNLIYPYLEYQFTFDKPIADRFYYINTTGKYKDYTVKLLVKKPTSKASILGSFTVIF